MKTPKILVSACLLGCPVRYDGQSKPVHHPYYNAGKPMAGWCHLPGTNRWFTHPRPAAEIQTDGRVMTGCNHDVTTAFVRGAEQALSPCASSSKSNTQF